jgi:hypothetical protein
MVNRRIRIRSINLCLEDLAPLGYEPDLFEPETDTKYRRLQEAVDKIQIRYRVGSVITGLVLAYQPHRNSGYELQDIRLQDG